MDLEFVEFYLVFVLERGNPFQVIEDLEGRGVLVLLEEALAELFQRLEEVEVVENRLDCEVLGLLEVDVEVNHTHLIVKFSLVLLVLDECVEGLVEGLDEFELVAAQNPVEYQRLEVLVGPNFRVRNHLEVGVKGLEQLAVLDRKGQEIYHHLLGQIVQVQLRLVAVVLRNFRVQEREDELHELEVPFLLIEIYQQVRTLQQDLPNQEVLQVLIDHRSHVLRDQVLVDVLVHEPEHCIHNCVASLEHLETV